VHRTTIKMSDTASNATTNPMHDAHTSVQVKTTNGAASVAASEGGKAVAAISTTKAVLLAIAVTSAVALVVGLGAGLGTKQETAEATSGGTQAESALQLNVAGGPVWKYLDRKLGRICTSADGQYIYSAVNLPNSGGAGFVDISKDGGASWTKAVQNKYISYNFRSIACSASGSTVVAVMSNHVVVSTDFGATWRVDEYYTATSKTAVTMSQDGSVAYVSTEAGGILRGTSADAFATLTLEYTRPSRTGRATYYTDIACSADCSLLVAAGFWGMLSVRDTSAAGTGTGAGVGNGAFVEVDNGDMHANSVTVSDDGSTILLNGGAREVILSTDRGQSWNGLASQAKYGRGCVSSDGRKIAAGAVDGALMYSEDRGASFKAITTVPSGGGFLDLDCTPDMSKMYVVYSYDGSSYVGTFALGRFALFPCNVTVTSPNISSLFSLLPCGISTSRTRFACSDKRSPLAVFATWSLLLVISGLVLLLAASSCCRSFLLLLLLFVRVQTTQQASYPLAHVAPARSSLPPRRHQFCRRLTLACRHA
jgi:hypothetical protein